MRIARLGAPISLVSLAFAGLLACSGGLGYGGNTPDRSGGGGGGVGGGGGGQTGAVTVGSGIQFVSSHNASMNPAVDTITAGSAMKWTWTGTLPHSIRSVGTPAFASSGVLTGAGTYSVNFETPGTYRYDCGVHGEAMTGVVVVIPAPAAAAVKVNDVTGI